MKGLEVFKENMAYTLTVYLHACSELIMAVVQQQVYKKDKTAAI